jgi:hypothetical protein
LLLFAAVYKRTTEGGSELLLLLFGALLWAFALGGFSGFRFWLLL